MSNWDDDFWSDEEASEVKSLSRRISQTQSGNNALEDLEPEQAVHDLPSFPDLPPIELPVQSFDISPPSGFRSPESFHSTESLPSPGTFRANYEHSSLGLLPSGGWGWSSLAAKVTSSAADLILMPEDDHKGQESSVSSFEAQQCSPARDRTRNSSTSKWFNSVASVLENVKASAGQSGRELIQVATEVLVKKPDMIPIGSEGVSPSSSRESLLRTEQGFFDSFTDDNARAEHSQTSAILVNAEFSNLQSSQTVSPHTIPMSSPMSDAHSRSRSFSSFVPPSEIPVVTIDPTLWNDEWDHEEEQGAKSPIKPPHRDYDSTFSPDESPVSAHNEHVSTGWLQDMFEGVKISATQSGQEILQASGVLTSEVIQKAKSIVPNMNSQKSLFIDLPGRKSVPLPSPSSQHTLNEMFSNAQMVYASDRESPEEESDHISRQSDMHLSALSNQGVNDLGSESDTEVSEFLWNFPKLPDSGAEFDQASFDALFSFYGGAEMADKLEQTGRERAIYLERNKGFYDSRLLDQVDQICNIFGQCESKVVNSALISNLERLAEEVLDWHVNVLKDYVNVNKNPDTFEKFDQAQALCTRTFAILAARSIDLLMHSIQQWNGDSKYALILAIVLRRFLVCFETVTDSVISSSIDIARQLCSSINEYDDDIAILRADIEVEMFEARFKVQDAVENVLPMLQCMVLSQ